MKKTISLVLSILLAFSFAVTAFAEGAPQYTETVLENVNGQQLAGSDNDILEGEMGVVPAPDDFDALITLSDYNRNDYNVAVALLANAGIDPDYFTEYESYQDYIGDCYRWPIDGKDMFFWSKETPRRLLSIQMDNVDLNGTVDISSLDKLTTLSIYGSTELTGIKLPETDKLIQVIINNAGLTSIDVTGLTSLQTLSIQSDITSLDLSKNKELKYLSAWGSHKLSSLNIAGLDKLESVDILHTAIKNFDARGTTYSLHANCNVQHDKFQFIQPENGILQILWDNGAYELYAEGVPGYKFEGWTGLPSVWTDLKDRFPEFEYDGYLTISAVYSADNTDDTDNADYDRVKGKTRYETSFAVAEMLGELYNEKFDNVVIASGQNFADALAGSYLAIDSESPILMCNNGKNDAELLSYIQENMSADGTVYILGGEAAVPLSTEESFLAAGLTVKRLKGKNRYDTNLAILAEMEDDGQPIIVATGRDYADSLSASAIGLPILLVDGKANSLSDAQRAFIASRTAADIYIIGGENAVSTAIEEELKTYSNVLRIKGKNRYDTSVQVAKFFFEDYSTVTLAYGHNFPDGLCGGPLASQLGAPLVLTRTQDYSAAKDLCQSENINRIVVLGGESLISNDVVEDILGK